MLPIVLVMSLLGFFGCGGPGEGDAPKPRVELRAPGPLPPATAPALEGKPPSEPPMPEPARAKGVESKPAETLVAPERACAIQSRVMLGARPEEMGLLRHGQEVWLMRASQQSLEVGALAEGTWEAFGKVSLKTKLSVRPEGLSRADGGVSLAWIDERGDLWLVEVGARKLGTPRVLVKGVDPRFAPALAEHSGQLLVAYTQTRDGAMHTMLTRVRGSETKSQDVTPTSHGAGAASFVLGSEKPVLVMLDARAGVSPLLEVPFDAKGEPLTAIVRTPVSQPYAPPLLSVFELAGQAQAVFTAIGRAAATAVGIVSLRRAEAPRPLVPSLGYGELHFDVSLGEGAVIFASESPTAPSLEASRDLVVMRIDEKGEGPSLTIKAEASSLARPQLVSEATAHAFSLVFFEGSELVWLRLACDA